ncbi:MAG: hypothetical protein ISS19_14015 [Bacteroidales bacterium]|nr:hypothetical protein [Bacteroidales bacterium]
MKTSIIFNLLTVAVLGMSLLLGGCKEKPMQVRQIPLEDFFKNPEKSRYRISPDGKYYSYMSLHIHPKGWIRLSNGYYRVVFAFISLNIAL